MLRYLPLAAIFLIASFPIAGSAAPLNANLLTCLPATSAGDVNHCRVDQSELVPAQALDSDFTVGYTFDCAPGTVDWLKIGISSNGGPTKYFKFGTSGTVSVPGGGPLNIKDDSTGLTRAMNFHVGCSLVITSATAVPTTVAISNAIDKQRLAAAGWAKTVAVTSSNHAWFVKSQMGAYCSLIKDIDKLSEAFGTSENAESIYEGGGEPARQLLADATKAASDNSAFDIGSEEPFAYLQANQAAILAHKPDCASITADSLVPNAAACHNNGLCVNNLADYNEAASTLRGIVADTRTLLDESTDHTPPQWFTVDSAIIQ